MTINFQPKLKTWFRIALDKNSEWNERRITVTLFNVRIELRFTNIKHR